MIRKTEKKLFTDFNAELIPPNSHEVDKELGNAAQRAAKTHQPPEYDEWYFESNGSYLS